MVAGSKVRSALCSINKILNKSKHKVVLRSDMEATHSRGYIECVCGKWTSVSSIADFPFESVNLTA
jgi:hypothetical protein